MNAPANNQGMSAGAVDVLAATVADLKAKGWVTDVIAALLIEASNKDRAAVAELIAYAECEEAKRLSLLPTSKGGTGNGQSYLATFQRYGFDGRDVYGFLDKLRRAALAAQEPRHG